MINGLLGFWVLIGSVSERGNGEVERDGEER